MGLVLVTEVRVAGNNLVESEDGVFDIVAMRIIGRDAPALRVRIPSDKILATIFQSNICILSVDESMSRL